MKRRLKVYGGIVLGVVVAWAALDYFSVEAMALAWHLRHGFHADVANIRVKVPFAYQADSMGPLGLAMTRVSGRMWHGGGTIMIDFFNPPPLETVQAAEAMLPNRLMTRNKVGERTVTFAGRSGTCIEFIPQMTDSRLNALIQSTDPRDINCWFGDVSVELIGPASVKDDFYGIIQTAQSVGRKN